MYDSKATIQNSARNNAKLSLNKKNFPTRQPQSGAPPYPYPFSPQKADPLPKISKVNAKHDIIRTNSQPWLVKAFRSIADVSVPRCSGE